jgi:hypothetical protein
MGKRVAYRDLGHHDDPATFGGRRQLAGGGLPMELLLLSRW